MAWQQGVRCLAVAFGSWRTKLQHSCKKPPTSSLTPWLSMEQIIVPARRDVPGLKMQGAREGSVVPYTCGICGASVCNPTWTEFHVTSLVGPAKPAKVQYRWTYAIPRDGTHPALGWRKYCVCTACYHCAMQWWIWEPIPPPPALDPPPQKQR